MRKFQIFSSFWIKTFALLLMTLDHVGLLLMMYHPYEEAYLDLASVFRTIGRLAMPLFVFMIVEGAIHTKNMKKYLLRLGIMAALISSALAVMAYVPTLSRYSSIANFGNIFLDLLLAAFTIWLLKQDNKWLKLLILLPLALATISFVTKGINYEAQYNVFWYPSFLYLQYDIISLLLAIGFYFAYEGAELYINFMDVRGYAREVWSEGNKRLLVSMLQLLVVAIVGVFHYLFVYMWPKAVYWDAKVQLASIVSGAIILLYNGKRGYNAKWFQYGAYLYYPLHILVAFGIFVLINGGF